MKLAKFLHGFSKKNMDEERHFEESEVEEDSKDEPDTPPFDYEFLLEAIAGRADPTCDTFWRFDVKGYYEIKGVSFNVIYKGNFWYALLQFNDHFGQNSKCIHRRLFLKCKTCSKIPDLKKSNHIIADEYESWWEDMRDGGKNTERNTMDDFLDYISEKFGPKTKFRSEEELTAHKIVMYVDPSPPVKSANKV